MANTTTRLYVKAISLAALETGINGDEAAGLKLAALGHTATHSAATYDRVETVPDTEVKLVKIASGTIIVPPGKKKICVGYVWDAGGPAHVLAVR